MRLDRFFFKDIIFLLKKINQSSLVKREILLLLLPFLGYSGFLESQGKVKKNGPVWLTKL